MNRPQYESRSATISESSSSPWPRRRPPRAPRMTCGAWLMFSMPPASTQVASPVWSCCAALITLWSPEPHRRLTVSAGTLWGSPALSAT